MRGIHQGHVFVRWSGILLAAAVWVAGCDSATEPPDPRPAAQIIRQSGDDQFAAAGDQLPEPLVVRVRDSLGDPIAGAPITFTVIAGGGSMENGSAVTGWKGVASSGAWTLGPTAGIQQVRAESGTVQVVFSARAYLPPTGLTGRLAFVSDRDGDPEIYAVDADGSGLERLTRNAGLDDAPAWSPDGRQLAFVSDRDGTPNIYTMAADGSSVIRRTAGVSTITIYGGAHDPAWSPDGSAIAFSTPHDGSATIATLDNTHDTVTFLFDYPGYEGQPAWSPDGRQLAFVSDYEAYDFVLNIYTMNADGTAPRLLTQGFAAWPNLAWYLHPAWSPDGRMIAFVYGSLINAHQEFPDVRFRVAIMSAEGLILKDLAWAGDIPWKEVLDPGSLSWSPDGRGIAYTFIDCDLVLASSCSNVRAVKYVSLDGSEGGTIVADARNPSWRR